MTSHLRVAPAMERASAQNWHQAESQEYDFDAMLAEEEAAFADMGVDVQEEFFHEQPLDPAAAQGEVCPLPPVDVKASQEADLSYVFRAEAYHFHIRMGLCSYYYDCMKIQRYALALQHVC